VPTSARRAEVDSIEERGEHPAVDGDPLLPGRDDGHLEGPSLHGFRKVHQPAPSKYSTATCVRRREKNT
jgi:hypothetical protein